MKAVHHSIIGLPRSGKTTFLAALWHLIDAGEVHTQLSLDRLTGDFGHLNQIVEAWRRCEEVQRTSIAAEVTVAVHLREQQTGRRIILEFPDLSGESFVRQSEVRSCSVSYADASKGLGGILLFVTANRAQDGMTIVDFGPILQGAEELGEPEGLIEWSPQMVPEQVRLVDILQFLQHPPFERRRRKVAVLVSAWDVVVNSGRTPPEWLKEELPLLYQFLEANPGSFEWRVYGVSAQGGDVTGGQREELARMTPSERVICIGPDTDLHDLTSPIVWLTAD